MITDFLLSLYSWTVIVVLTIIFGTLAVIMSFLSEYASDKIAQSWGRLILYACRVKMNIKGLENISPDSSYVITSNHQSYFDIFVLLACLDTSFKFIAKKDLFNIPFLGQGMKRLGYISIDRKNMRSALKSVKKSTELLKNKISILIFPEGTRSPNGELLSFKKGGLNMFLKQSNITVLPVVIKGTVNILKKDSFVIHIGRTVELQVLKPLSPIVKKGDGNVVIEEVENKTRAVLKA